MLKLIHKLAEIPAIYDFSQKLAGGDVTNEILKKELSMLIKKGSALDVGGGTGFMRPLFPETWDYTCLDNDPKKLGGFKKKFPQDKIIQASATRIPKPEGTYDLCILSAVSHHLPSSELDCALKEISRVLRPNGQLLFLDALLNKNNIVGKILWALDRGSFPRSFKDLKTSIEKVFIIEKIRIWRAFHECALFI